MLEGDKQGKCFSILFHKFAPVPTLLSRQV